MSELFAGLDWASRVHVVCVIDERAKVLARFEVTHDTEGLKSMRQRLQGLGVRRIAIERPNGLIVDYLLEAGFAVVPIHPNVVKATRPRYRSHGGKSDASDAFVLADLLRTDGHRFQPLVCQSDDIRALRALVRGRDSLVQARVHVANQLRALLESFWPGAVAVFADIDSPISLAFIQCYPTPGSASRLGVKRMAAFCSKHAYCGRRPADELLERLRQAPVIALGDLELKAKGDLATSLARVLATIVEQIRALTRQIEHDVGASEDGQILMSFPRAGHVCAAQLLAEIGGQRDRYLSEEQLAAEAGVTPVTYESGKARSVTFRWACNHRLRKALTCLADNSRHASSWAHTVYAAARARGCDHPHAIRILARAWARVIWRAWQDRKPYDPALHGRARELVIAGGG